MSRVPLPAIALAACLLVLAGCSSPSVPEPAAPPRSEPATPSAEPTSAPDQGPVSLDRLSVELKVVARGFEQPLQVTGAADGTDRLFVVEQPGTVRVIRDGKVSEGSFLDIRRKISAGGERGLLGLAFDPNYESNGRFYVNYTNLDGDTIVERYTADDPASDTPALSKPTRLLKLRQPYANHNGGCIVFQPGTTRLWVGTGDGGSAGDPENRAQNPNDLLGKMLAIEVGGSIGKPVIVQTGLRNPWRFSFDRANNDLWIGDVGQGDWEEIDTVPLLEAQGVNWGWDYFEGTHAYPPGSSPRSSKGLTFPVAEYDHSQGESITGGHVYRGSRFPAMEGVYFYGDFVDRWIAGLRTTDENGEPLEEPATKVLVGRGRVMVSSFGEGDDGELYVCDYTGTLLRVEGTAK